MNERLIVDIDNIYFNNFRCLKLKHDVITDYGSSPFILMAQWILQELLRDKQMFDIKFDITTFTGFINVED